MNVRQLLDYLSKCPMDYEVQVQGMDRRQVSAQGFGRVTYQDPMLPDREFSAVVIYGRVS